jgi:hypothetical protein
MRIADFLAEQRVAYEPVPHPPAFTAQRRAKFLHLSGSQVAKSVLLRGPAGYLLAVLPATHHIDTDLLSGELGGPVRLADDREIVKVFEDCLSPEAILILETHTHVDAVRMRCRDFERLERPRRLPFARRNEPLA